MEASRKGSNFIFDCITLLYCKCHKVSLQLSGSNIDFPDWIKPKKGTTNPINDDDKCFKYAATTALNHKKFGKKLKRISKIKLFKDI